MSKALGKSHEKVVSHVATPVYDAPGKKQFSSFLFLSWQY
jgi:hypothetical protein